MVHSADDFRSHVTRSTTSLLRIAFFSLTGHTEVSNSEIAVLFEDQILRFEISVDNSFGVNILKAEDDAARHKFLLEREVLACS